MEMLAIKGIKQTCFAQQSDEGDIVFNYYLHKRQESKLEVIQKF
jgi:hypothetical protein